MLHRMQYCDCVWGFRMNFKGRVRIRFASLCAAIEFLGCCCDRDSVEAESLKFANVGIFCNCHFCDCYE